MKPIEPGCLAMVIRSYTGLEGSCVTVIQKTHSTEIGMLPGGELIQAGVNHWWVHHENREFIAHESQLIRIDGHEPVTSEEEQEACV
ncbi:hypothetical protein [Halomonas cupida]|uniref:hypothetical protein n=1 Tax=Halomonas cupida TaxID=44933 RepID=UPI003A95CBA6